RNYRRWTLRCWNLRARMVSRPKPRPPAGGARSRRRPTPYRRHSMSTSAYPRGPHEPRPPGLSLKVYCPPADEPAPPAGHGHLWPAMTLSQFYFSFVRPVWAVERDCDPKTLVEY